MQTKVPLQEFKSISFVAAVTEVRTGRGLNPCGLSTRPGAFSVSNARPRLPGNLFLRSAIRSRTSHLLFA